MSTRTIEIRIKVTGIEGWEVEWNNAAEADGELEKVRGEVKNAIADDLGIERRNIKVETSLLTP